MRQKGLIKQFFSRTAKFSVMRNLVLVMLLLSLILSVYFFFELNKKVNESFSGQAELFAERSSSKIESFMKPVITASSIIVEWEKTDVLDFNNPAFMSKLIIPLIKKSPMIYSVVMTRKESRGFYLNKTDKGYNYGHTEDIQWQEIDSFLRKTGLRGYAISRPYTFPGTSVKTVGLIKGSEDVDSDFHLSVSVRMRSMYELWESLKFSRNTNIVFVQGDLFDSDVSNKTETSENSTGLHAQDGFYYDRSLQKIINKFWFEKTASERRQAFKFLYEDELWWGVFSSFRKNGKKQWFCIAVPEKDLHLPVSDNRDFIRVISVGINLLVIIMIILLVRIYRNAVKKENNASYEEYNLSDIISRGEGQDLEFKSSMRLNLKTMKSGREIEMAFLKTIAAFLNSDGGILLIGVDDKGEPLGIDMQGFANEDKFLLHFNNLIKEFIGLEFSEYIDFRIKDYKDKRILIVECTPCYDPVFLKKGSDELFFIRTGPASLQLSMSKTLAYIKNRSASLEN